MEATLAVPRRPRRLRVGSMVFLVLEWWLPVRPSWFLCRSVSPGCPLYNPFSWGVCSILLAYLMCCRGHTVRTPAGGGGGEERRRGTAAGNYEASVPGLSSAHAQVHMPSLKTQQSKATHRHGSEPLFLELDSSRVFESRTRSSRVLSLEHRTEPNRRRTSRTSSFFRVLCIKSPIFAVFPAPTFPRF